MLQVSHHELSFRVSVTVPDSGNFTFEASPATIGTSGDARRLTTVSSSSEPAVPGETITVSWEVDLSRPETLVVSRPERVTTEGNAEFGFACEVHGVQPTSGCSYEYQMAGEAGTEIEWDSLDWMPTVRKMC